MNENEQKKVIKEIRKLLELDKTPDAFWEGSESPQGFRLFKTYEEALAHKKERQKERKKRIAERKRLAKGQNSER
jgi:hypothetical protein